MVRESLCYLTMTESSYPKRMAFLYLDDVADAILTELVNEFQEDVSFKLCIGMHCYVMRKNMICMCSHAV